MNFFDYGDDDGSSQEYPQEESFGFQDEDVLLEEDSVITQLQLFKRQEKFCYQKCIHSYRDPDVSAGEAVCIRRCLTKFYQVQNLIRDKARKEGGFPTPLY